MSRAEFRSHIPVENNCRNIRDALQRARAILKEQAGASPELLAGSVQNS
jgi:hypothetical protein